jgi:hypothetical protein
METSEDYSPIIDYHERINKEIAIPVLQSFMNSLISSINFYQFNSKFKFFRRWKKETIIASRNQLKQFNDFCFLAAQKARLGHRSMENVIKSQFSRVFMKILLVSAASSLNYEQEIQDLKNKKNRIGKIKTDYQKEVTRLREVNEKYHSSLQATSEYVINEIKMLKEENSQLQDKLLTYEIHFGSYIRETENLLKTSKISIH